MSGAQKLERMFNTQPGQRMNKAQFSELLGGVLKWKEDQVAKIFTQCDADGDGYITWPEFKTWFESHRGKSKTKATPTTSPSNSTPVSPTAAPQQPTTPAKSPPAEPTLASSVPAAASSARQVTSAQTEKSAAPEIMTQKGRERIEKLFSRFPNQEMNLDQACV